MNREQRRIAKKNGFVPVQVGEEKIYHFTKAQLDSYIAKAVKEQTSKIRQEASEDAITNIVMIFLVAINKVAKYGKKRLDDILLEVNYLSELVDGDPKEMANILERCKAIGYKFEEKGG